jgi:hypothetical protein
MQNVAGLNHDFRINGPCCFSTLTKRLSAGHYPYLRKMRPVRTRERPGDSQGRVSGSASPLVCEELRVPSANPATLRRLRENLSRLMTLFS